MQHYTSAPSEASAAAAMNLLAGEAPPDFSDISADVMSVLAGCATPPGVYVDAFPLHLLSRNALTWLAERSGLDTDLRRFRPNLLVEIDGAGASPAEDGWVGARIAIGETVLRVDSRTVRCAMPARAQPLSGLVKQTTLMRALVDHSQRRLGVNIIVERAGIIHAGDAILRLD